MKIIFLDVDNVLNSIPLYRIHGPNYIDSIMLNRLYSITVKTGAKIVLSSNWRLDYNDCFKIKSMLSKFWMDLHDTTPDFSDRNEEIKHWVSINKVERYVILDDDSRIVVKKKNGLFIKINEETGITDEDVYTAVSFLNQND